MLAGKMPEKFVRMLVKEGSQLSRLLTQHASRQQQKSAPPVHHACDWQTNEWCVYLQLVWKVLGEPGVRLNASNGNPVGRVAHKDLAHHVQALP